VDAAVIRPWLGSRRRSLEAGVDRPTLDGQRRFSSYAFSHLAIGGKAMRTIILAFAIAFMGLVMIGGGLWGLFLLIGGTARPPLRYYAMTIGMISGGLAMVGLGQALRLLVVIIGHG
jgi:hypothetical protein